MDEGLYESLFTAQLEARVAHAREFGLEDRRATVDAADQPYVLARHVHDAVAPLARNRQRAATYLTTVCGSAPGLRSSSTEC